MSVCVCVPSVCVVPSLSVYYRVCVCESESECMCV